MIELYAEGELWLGDGYFKHKCIHKYAMMAGVRDVMEV